MRILLTFFIITTSLVGYAQSILEVPFKDGIPTYSETFETTSNKDQQFKLLKSWVAKSFVNANSVIQQDDQEGGRMIVKATLTPHFQYLGQKRVAEVDILLQVDVKENKYRYILEVTNYYHKQTPQPLKDVVEIANGRKKSITNTKSYAAKQVTALNEEINSLIESLKKGMAEVDDF